MDCKHNKFLVSNARNLRKNMTKEERHLWYDFLRPYPVRFLRQKILGKYIVDFYCAEAKLIVELDGSQHCTPEQLKYDKKRTEYLEAQGLRVIRFSNLDVLRRYRDVCETIYQIMEARTAQKP